MARIGYVRIGGTTYINALSEDVRDRLISVLESMNLDIKYEREEYYYDFVEDEMKYSWAFTIECTMEQTTEIVSRLETEMHFEGSVSIGVILTISADDEDDVEE